MANGSVFGGPKSVTAANLKIILNNSVCGFVNNAVWTIDFGVRAIYEIDRIVPRELAPGSYSVKFSFTGIKIIKQYFEDLRLIANPGLNYVLPYISIAVLDRITNEPVLNIQSAMIESVQYNSASKGILNFNFSGIGFTALNGSNLIDVNYSGSPISLVRK